MKFLIDHGHVNLMMIFLGGMQKQMLKEFPDMAKPARPWPTTPEQMHYASLKTPSNASELYGLTNIWLAKLKLTPKQWKRVQPVSVPPAPNLPNGKMALRNPKASRSGLAGAIGIDFHWSEGEFEFAGERFQTIGVRYRGNGTYIITFRLKQSYSRSESKDRNAGVTTLNFTNSIPIFPIKDAAQKLFQELGPCPSDCLFLFDRRCAGPAPIRRSVICADRGHRRVMKDGTVRVGSDLAAGDLRFVCRLGKGLGA
jgi:hypothetical protein